MTKRMIDFRTDEEIRECAGYVIHCETCGNDSLVGIHHRRYCPCCGPDSVANITFTKMTGNDHKKLHRIEVSYELSLRRCEEILVDDDTYNRLLFDGTATTVRPLIKPAMEKTLSEAIPGDFEEDLAVYDLDNDRQIIGWS